MTNEKRMSLIAAGWEVGDAEDLLELTPDERLDVERRVSCMQDLVYDTTPPVGGKRGPAPLRKAPKIKDSSQDELGRHLLVLFLLHPSIMQSLWNPSGSLDDISDRLSFMSYRTKRRLLSRVERLLGIPTP